MQCVQETSNHLGGREWFLILLISQPGLEAPFPS